MRSITSQDGEIVVGPARRWEWSILTNIFCCGIFNNDGTVGNNSRGSSTSTVTSKHQHTTIYRITDWLISKPGLLTWVWITMGLTIFYGRDAFLVHVCTLTGVLLIILYKINSLYGHFDNPHYNSFIIVLSGGFLHVIVPFIGTLLDIKPALFTHLCICCLVHVLHLTQCYTVFKDISFSDNEFITILWLVNIGEMLVNIVFVFLSSKHHGREYITCALAVELMTLMIVNLKLKAGKQNDSGKTNVSIAGTIIHLKPNHILTCLEYCQTESSTCFHSLRHTFHQLFHEHMLSRLVLMAICGLTIALMAQYPKPSYLIFMIFLAITIRLTVLKIKKSMTLIPYVLDKLLIIIPLALIVFTFATEIPALIYWKEHPEDDDDKHDSKPPAGLHHVVGTVLTIITFNIGLIILFFIIGIMTNGTCYSVRLFFLMIIFATITSILHILHYNDSYDQVTVSNTRIRQQWILLFACMTVTTTLVFFLSKIKLSNQRDYSSTSGTASKGNGVSNVIAMTGITNGTSYQMGAINTERVANSSRIHPMSVHITSTHISSSGKVEAQQQNTITAAETLTTGTETASERKEHQIALGDTKRDEEACHLGARLES